jgi:GAF domain-containing protein
MLKFIQDIFAPPVFEDNERTRVAALLNSILWSVIIIGTVYTAAAPFMLEQYTSTALTAAIVIVSLISRQFMIKGYLRAATITLLVIFHAVLVIAIIVSDGVFGASYFSLIMTTLIAGVLLGGRGAYVMAGINVLTGLGIMLVQDSLPPTMIPQTPVTFWSSLIVYVIFIAALQHAYSKGSEKLLENFRKAQEELTDKNRELQELSLNLENSITTRTAELESANQRNERRARQFEAISQVSRVINQTWNLEDLLPQITQTISQQFGFYHVGIFLLDGNNEFAILAAANSEGGQRMLARNHRLRVGQTGIVGNVAGNSIPRIALDTGSDVIYFNNPDLPNTRSEMALPLLRAGRQIIGVLDVQSTEPNAFGQEDIRILTTLADQVSIAIDNARLFEETQKTLLESEAIYRRNLRAGWNRFTRGQNLAGVRRRSLKTNFLLEPMELPDTVEAIRLGSVYKKKTDTDKSSQLTMPMKLRGEVVGMLNVKTEGEREWSADEMDIINAIMERAALSIENARLLDESRRIAEKEHVIGDISAKIGAGTEIETILRTAVRELGAQINGAQVTVEIGGGEEQSPE